MPVFYMKELGKPSCSFMIRCGHTAVQYFGLPMVVINGFVYLLLGQE